MWLRLCLLCLVVVAVLGQSTFDQQRSAIRARQRFRKRPVTAAAEKKPEAAAEEDKEEKLNVATPSQPAPRRRTRVRTPQAGSRTAAAAAEAVSRGTESEASSGATGSRSSATTRTRGRPASRTGSISDASPTATRRGSSTTTRARGRPATRTGGSPAAVAVGGRRAGTRTRPTSRRQRPTTRASTTTTTTTRSTTTTPAETTDEGTLLVPPVPEKCASRPKHWKMGDHWYFYTADDTEYQEVNEDGETVGKRYDWLESRNVCRRHCMDSISLETEDEWNVVKQNMSDRNIFYLWTSGRLCDFKGCESREDLKPLDINGWFWSGTNVKLAPTNKTPEGWEKQPWSQTGHKEVPQPDNAEFDINNTTESCLGLLNNIYDDGIAWHDIACYHRKPTICEDSEVLLAYARALNERDELGLTID